MALFTTVPYLVGICCCYPDKSKETLISTVNKLGLFSQITDKEWVFTEKIALAKNLFCTVQFVTSVHFLKARSFMQLLLNELISCLGTMTNSLCHFSLLVSHCDFSASETCFCLFKPIVCCLAIEISGNVCVCCSAKLFSGRNVFV